MPATSSTRSRNQLLRFRRRLPGSEDASPEDDSFAEADTDTDTDTNADGEDLENDDVDSLATPSSISSVTDDDDELESTAPAVTVTTTDNMNHSKPQDIIKISPSPQNFAGSTGTLPNHSKSVLRNSDDKLKATCNTLQTSDSSSTGRSNALSTTLPANKHSSSVTITPAFNSNQTRAREQHQNWETRLTNKSKFKKASSYDENSRIITKLPSTKAVSTLKGLNSSCFSQVKTNQYCWQDQQPTTGKKFNSNSRSANKSSSYNGTFALNGVDSKFKGQHHGKRFSRWDNFPKKWAHDLFEFGPCDSQFAGAEAKIAARRKVTEQNDSLSQKTESPKASQSISSGKHVNDEDPQGNAMSSCQDKSGCANSRDIPASRNETRTFDKTCLTAEAKSSAGCGMISDIGSNGHLESTVHDSTEVRLVLPGSQSTKYITIKPVQRRMTQLKLKSPFSKGAAVRIALPGAVDNAKYVYPGGVVKSEPPFHSTRVLTVLTRTIDDDVETIPYDIGALRVKLPPCEKGQTIANGALLDDEKMLDLSQALLDVEESHEFKQSECWKSVPKQENVLTPQILTAVSAITSSTSNANDTSNDNALGSNTDIKVDLEINDTSEKSGCGDEFLANNEITLMESDKEGLSHKDGDIVVHKTLLEGYEKDDAVLQEKWVLEDKNASWQRHGDTVVCSSYYEVPKQLDSEYSEDATTKDEYFGEGCTSKVTNDGTLPIDGSVSAMTLNGIFPSHTAMLPSLSAMPISPAYMNLNRAASSSPVPIQSAHCQYPEYMMVYRAMDDGVTPGSVVAQERNGMVYYYSAPGFYYSY